MPSRKKRTKNLRYSSFSRKSRRKNKGIKVLLLLLVVGVCSTYAAHKLDVEGYFTIKKVVVGQPEFISGSYLDSVCRKLFLGRNIFSWQKNP